MTITKIKTQLCEIVALSENATAGPWHWVDANTDEPVDYSAKDESLAEEAQDDWLGASKSLRTVWEEGEGWGETAEVSRRN